ncbi:MAG: winged helix DNA-binding protein [Thermoleophilaceae bacterium]|nr:winged helix DNA-binding protein [Thermoleophilaceae bacterium]
MTDLTYQRPIPALLTDVKNAAVGRLFARMGDAGFGDVREGHGCVFGFIDMEHGSRLTDLAEASGFTKQSVGEAVAELERLGYLERRACPDDGRAKIIHLTDRGREAALTGRRIFAEIEAEWAEEVGAEAVAAMRAAAERIAELEGSGR